MSPDRTRTDRLAARWPATVRRRGVAAGLAFGTVGFMVTLVVAGGWILSDTDAGNPLFILGVVFGLPVAAGLAAAAIGTPLWWKLVEEPDDPTHIRGGLAGAAVGVLAHPLMWFLFGIGWLVVDPSQFARRGGPVAILRELLLGYLVLSVASALVGGLVTVPVATGTGVALARLRRRAPEVHRAARRLPPQDL